MSSPLRGDGRGEGENMPRAKILVVDDEKLIRWSLEQNLSKEGYEVVTAADGKDALSILESDVIDLVLLDVRLPGIDGVEVLKAIRGFASVVPTIMITADDAVQTAVACMKGGASDYVVKPFNFDELKIVIEKALETASLATEVRRLRHEKEVEYRFDNIVGKSEKMQEVFRMVTKISQSDATTVLIHGESGTGKDLVARAIHYGSARNQKPFMEINCTALPETLLESELLGYEKGAFTDAKSAKKGLFEIADGGTIFLDEIGEMKMTIQVKLLRAIEDKKFKRLGGAQDIKVDVRVIAATNRDLAVGVKDGRFREDLYYRLKVIPVELPPLRDRKEDIPLLIDFFIQKFNREFRRSIKGISAKARELLTNYNWPGNVRELRNVIERAIILESEEIILPEHLPIEITMETSPEESPGGFELKLPAGGISIETLEDNLVRQALAMASNNQTRAAKLLGMSRDALRYRMKKMGLVSE
jgi:DNA-binding NtrC family response regulator